MTDNDSASNTYIAYIKTVEGEYVELQFHVCSVGEARYLARRAQIGGQIIDVFLRARPSWAQDEEG